MINKDWTTAPLGKVVTLQRGFDLPSHRRRHGDVPIVTSSGIGGMHDRAMVKGPGVVTGRYGTIGEVFFIESDFWPHNTTLFAQNFHGNDPLFVSYLLRTIDFRSHSGKSGVPGVNRNDLHEEIVAVPVTLAEQQAIAEALSDVDALISAQDRLIAKKRAIKQGAMQELLTGRRRLPGFGGEWENKSIGSLFQLLGTANNPRSDLTPFGAIEYLHYGDVHTKWKTFLDCERASLPLIDADKVRGIPFLEDGDLVMVDASEDYEGVGVSLEVKNASGRKIVAGLHTLLLRANKADLADGFKGYLQYIPSLKLELIKAATGISVYGLLRRNIEGIQVFLPNVDEQTAIATVLSDMDAEIAALERRRDKTRLLKQGMMQELLTGRIRLP